MTPLPYPSSALEYQHYGWHYMLLGTRLRPTSVWSYNFFMLFFLFFEKTGFWQFALEQVKRYFFSTGCNLATILSHHGQTNTRAIALSASWCCELSPSREYQSLPWLVFVETHSLIPTYQLITVTNRPYCWAGSVLHKHRELPLLYFSNHTWLLSMRVNIQIHFWRVFSSLLCLAEY